MFKEVVLTKAQLASVKDPDVAWLQQWLNTHCNSNLVVDGVGGSATRLAFIAAFVNRNAKAITEAEMQSIAAQLGDTKLARVKAVAEVEARGGGWFDSGLPKILYERHLFWRNSTKQRKRITYYANPTPGGYTLDQDKNGLNDSWEKLAMACCVDPLIALQSISIGKFQVLGRWYKECGYQHPIEMLYAATKDEYVHYCFLRDYILKVAKLKTAFLRISNTADSCVAFAKGYNGVNYATYNYHTKIAAAYAKYSK